MKPEEIRGKIVIRSRKDPESGVNHIEAALTLKAGCYTGQTEPEVLKKIKDGLRDALMWELYGDRMSASEIAEEVVRQQLPRFGMDLSAEQEFRRSLRQEQGPVELVYGPDTTPITRLPREADPPF